MLSFALILIHALTYLVAPNIASTPMAQIICYAPSCLLEIAMGIWLLLKGISPAARPALQPGLREAVSIQESVPKLT